MRDELVEAQRRQAAGEFLTQRQQRLLAEQEEVEALILGVPDVNDPDLINYWRQVGDKWIYLEGWADACLAGTGFPPMEEGGTSEKLAYMEDLTPRILEKRATDNSINRRLRLIRGGFRELEEAGYLYGVTWGVYQEV